MRTRTSSLATSLLVLAVALAGAGVAKAEPAPPGSEPSPSSSCEAVFGNAPLRSYNAALREYQLDQIRKTAEGISVVHHVGKWRRPAAVTLAHMRVLDVDAAGQTATIVIEGETSGCEAGTYRVTVDDSVGRTARVLGIVDNGVLVVSDEAFWVVARQGARAPQVELVWRSSYSVLATAPRAGSGSKSIPKRGASAAAATAGGISDTGRTPKRPKTTRQPKGIR